MEPGIEARSMDLIPLPPLQEAADEALSSSDCLASCFRQLLRCSSLNLFMNQGGSQTPYEFSKGILCPCLLASYGSKALLTDSATRACPSQSLGRHSSPASRTATPFSSKHWPPSPIKSETISFHLHQGAKNTKAVYLFPICPI